MQINKIKKSDLSKLADTNVYDLTIGKSGVTCIEQMIFNKMFLYSSIYNHQKVETLDCMLKGVFEYIRENQITIKIKGVSLDFENPVSFLYFSEYNFYSLPELCDNKQLNVLITKIIERKLMKRAVIFDKKTINNERTDLVRELFSTTANSIEKGKILRNLAEKIRVRAGVDCLLSEIWIDIPKPPNLKEGSMPLVRIENDGSTDFERISSFFPYSQFQSLYTQNKSSNYVFCPEEYITPIAEATKQIFEEDYKIILNKSAFRYP